MLQTTLYNLLHPTNHKGIFFLAALFLFTAYSCGEKKNYSGDKEGRIIYDVTYPTEEPSLMLDLFPKELVFYFKGDMMCSELRSSYDLISSNMIIDNDHKHFTQMLKNMRDRHFVSLEENETKTWTSMQSLRYEETNDYQEILGHNCKKVLAYLPDSNITPLELYYTKEIDLSTNNWWNQYYAIDGFLLGYDIELFGKRMRVRAREVIHETVSDLKFKVPSSYSEVSSGEMNNKMQEIVQEYIGK